MGQWYWWSTKLPKQALSTPINITYCILGSQKCNSHLLFLNTSDFAERNTMSFCVLVPPSDNYYFLLYRFWIQAMLKFKKSKCCFGEVWGSSPLFYFIMFLEKTLIQFLAYGYFINIPTFIFISAFYKTLQQFLKKINFANKIR